jgi:hypothetical protein
MQNNSTKEILQGARTGVIMKPSLAYAGYQSVFPHPDQDADLTVALRNIGADTGRSVSATLSTTDSFVTVTTASAAFNDIAVGGTQHSSSPYRIHVAGNCPNPHLATMNLQITAAGGCSTSTSFPLNVTLNPGFTDSMESGANGWTHNGILDNWHQTTHRYSSPTHSWYCGVDNSWQYTNENDARLMTPYFTVSNGGTMSFQHFYATEATYDFALVEIDNGSGFWSQLACYNGTNSDWEEADFDLSAWAGQTVQVRFRFVSDASTTAEGWYLDDFWASSAAGVTEQKPTSTLRLSPIPGLLTVPAEIKYQIPAGMRGDLAVYDVGGRMVAHLGHNLYGTGSVTWRLTDRQDRRVGAGAYFVRLTTGQSNRTIRVATVH